MSAAARSRQTRNALFGLALSDAFESEDEARAAWERHRASMLRMFGQDGRRPIAWWAFDRPEGLAFDRDTERSTLYEAGLLDPDERERPGGVLARRVRQGEQARIRVLYRSRGGRLADWRGGDRGAPALGRRPDEPGQEVDRSARIGGATICVGPDMGKPNALGLSQAPPPLALSDAQLATIMRLSEPLTPCLSRCAAAHPRP